MRTHTCMHVQKHTHIPYTQPVSLFTDREDCVFCTEEMEEWRERKDETKEMEEEKREKGRGHYNTHDCIYRTICTVESPVESSTATKLPTQRGSEVAHLKYGTAEMNQLSSSPPPDYLHLYLPPALLHLTTSTCISRDR